MCSSSSSSAFSISVSLASALRGSRPVNDPLIRSFGMSKRIWDLPLFRPTLIWLVQVWTIGWRNTNKDVNERQQCPARGTTKYDVFSNNLCILKWTPCWATFTFCCSLLTENYLFTGADWKLDQRGHAKRRMDVNAIRKNSRRPSINYYSPQMQTRHAKSVRLQFLLTISNISPKLKIVRGYKVFRLYFSRRTRSERHIFYTLVSI